MARPVVTFLTDFGAGSGYPAQMKAEVLRRLPDATLVDLSHDVPPFDVLAGALLLEACVPRFPLAAVHVAVVDPGVGTARRPLCVEDGAGRRLVGPDNGLLAPFLGPGSTAFLLSDPELVPRDPSPTFHGRDLFAPVAAWLAGGGDPTRLGPRVADPVRLPGLAAERTAGRHRRRLPGPRPLREPGHEHPTGRRGRRNDRRRDGGRASRPPRRHLRGRVAR